MALFDTAWYTNFGNGSNTGYYAIPVWTALTAYTAGQTVRQAAAPAVGSERVFVCIIAGTSLASEPTWTVTRGAKTAEAAGPTWQECTGIPGLCGDTVNSVTTATTRSQAITLGEVIYDSGTASLQICSTAGTAGAGTPSFSTTAGTTTADNTATWTSLGLASGYAAWANPHARLQAACATTWGAAGNTIYVSSNHAETQSATMAIPVGGSTAAAPYRIICVTSNVAPSSTLATSATVTTTGTSNIQINSNAYVYGIQFFCGTGAGAVTLFWGVNNVQQSYENCIFKVVSTNTGSALSLNSGNVTATYVDFIGCTFLFSAAAQQILLAWNSLFRKNCIFANSATVPTTLFSSTGSSARGGIATIRDCDLSAIVGSLVAVGGGEALTIYFQNCKLGAGVSPITGTQLLNNACTVFLHNSDSSNTNYRYYYANFAGTIQQETTIVRTGSLATDGTTPLSWNITNNTSPNYYSPFVSEEIAIWNDTSGSLVTATLYLISNTTLNNNDLWAEIEYPSSSTFPLGATVDSRMTPLGTPASLTADTSVWGGSTNKYKIVLTFTPQMKGPIKARFFSAKASATIYIDPYCYLS